MLSIGKMVARSGDYYLRTVAAGREEYYTGSGEAPGTWLGRGADVLELRGEVAPEDLRALLAGVSPNGEILTNGGVAAANRVTGFDLTFSAPKSVSLLYGLSGPEVSAAVKAAHADAAAQALGYLERAALRVRRGAGGERQLEAEGLVAAAFVHRTSRAGDPQLHTHVLVANVTKGVDGVWSAPDARLLYFHARTAGFLYETALRARLGQTLGVGFGPVRRGIAELDGVSKTLLRTFSTRRREIEAYLERTGAHSARAAEVAALATRSPKDSPADADDTTNTIGLRARWLARAAELGFAEAAHGRSVLDGVLGSREWSLPSAAERRDLVTQLLGPEGLTAHASAFERRDVVRAVAEGLPDGADVGLVEALAEQTMAGRHVVPLASVGRGGELRHTTLELLRVERALVDRAVRARGAGAGLAAPNEVNGALRAFPLLADEQVSMVTSLTTSGHGVEVVIGKAGAGKTLALAAARQAWHDSGFAVIGTSLSARAARGLAQSAGIESVTLARLGRELSSGALVLTERDIVVVDEAAMVGTRDLAALLEHAETARAKVVLVGDPRQLPEIAAGGAFHALAGRLGAIELTENRRQREPWERQALEALRAGRAELAVATYEQAGRVHIASSPAESRRALVDAWLPSFVAKEETLMLAVTRRDVGELNETARQMLRHRGLLGADGLVVGERGFAVGDRVVCLRNDRRLDVLNGTIGTITRLDVTSGLHLDTEEGERHVPVPYLEAGHLDHGYALTVHKAQGATVERAFVLATESLTKEAGYVALSRARAGSELFVALDASDADAGLSHDPRRDPGDPLADLARRLRTTQAKRLASDELGSVLGHEPNAPLVRPVYREGSEIGDIDGSSGGESGPAGREARGRQRTRADVLTQSTDRTRREAGVDRPLWPDDTPGRGRSLGRGR